MDDTVASILGSVERRPYEITAVCGVGVLAGLDYALPALVWLVLDGGAMLASRDQAIVGPNLALVVGAAVIVHAKELWDGATWAWTVLVAFTSMAVLFIGFQMLSLVGALVTGLLSNPGAVSLGANYAVLVVLVTGLVVGLVVLLVLLKNTAFYLPETRVPDR